MLYQLYTNLLLHLQTTCPCYLYIGWKPFSHSSQWYAYTCKVILCDNMLNTSSILSHMTHKDMTRDYMLISRAKPLCKPDAKTTSSLGFRTLPRCHQHLEPLGGVTYRKVIVSPEGSTWHEGRFISFILRKRTRVWCRCYYDILVLLWRRWFSSRGTDSTLARLILFYWMPRVGQLIFIHP